MLIPTDRLPGHATTPDVGFDGLDQRMELNLVVDGRDHHVTPFPPLRVIAIVPHHEPPDPVIRRVDHPHDRRLGPRQRLPPSLTADRPRRVATDLPEQRKRPPADRRASLSHLEPPVGIEPTTYS
ncbi:hypothetical protein, partial [Intrasporangium sp.]|uniref:hypothetical protein n=1 Tax=Intrasporangium sp. TaxID=1925024 RepID=UPI00293B7212